MKLNNIFYTVIFALISVAQLSGQETKQTKPDFPFFRYQPKQTGTLSKTSTISSNDVVLSKYDGTVDGYLSIHFVVGQNDYFAVRYEIPQGIIAPYTIKEIKFQNHDSATIWPRMLVTHGSNSTTPDLNNPIVEYNNVSGPSKDFLVQQTQTTVNNLNDIFFVLQMPPGEVVALPTSGPAIGADVSLPHQQGNLFSTDGATFSELRNYNLAVEVTIEGSTPPINADLVIAKSDAVDPVLVGDNVTYTLTINNNGPETAENVIVTDNLPTGVTFVSVNPSQGNCSESGGTVTCDLGNMNNGASATVSVVVNTTTAGIKTNNANVTSSTNDPNNNNNSTSEQTTVNAIEADLWITKSDAVDPVFVGDNVTYTLTINNNGPETAENVVVTDNLPSGMTFVSANSSQGSCNESGGTVTCNLGNMNNGGSATVTVVVNTTTAGTKTNNASVISSTSDSNGNNNSTSEQTIVNAIEADLSITKSDAVDPVLVGDNVTYTLTINNNGPETAENVVVTDNFPAGVTFVSANSSQGSCNESGGTVTCNLGNMNNGGSATITVVVNTTIAGTKTNNASVNSSTSDPNNNNNSTSEQTTVNAIEADLSIAKSDAVDPVLVGDNVTYTLTINNNGSQTAENVVVTDNLPDGFTFVSANASQGSCNESGGTVTCNLGNMNNGASTTVTVVVNTTTLGTKTNNASVNSSTSDPNNNNNSTSEQTTVNDIEADLSITKSDAVDPVLVGDNVTYTLTINNNGLQTAENVVVTDNLPTGVTFVSANSSQGSCSESGGTVTCDLGTMNNGANASVTVVVNTTSAGSITNSASVNSSTNDPNNNNNSANEETTINTTVADLSIDKTDVSDPVLVGDNVAYTLSISNSGPQTAENVVVTDNLPSGMTYVSAIPSQGSCSESSGTVTCNLGNMNNGSNATITVVVNPTTAGTKTNNASVNSSTSDPNNNNNSATEQTVVNSPVADLSITKSDAEDPVLIGDDVTYTMIITNSGPNTADNVVLTDNLPAGVTFVSVNTSQGNCNGSSVLVACNFGDMSNGASATVTVVVNTTSLGVLTNTASVASPTIDPNNNNNSTTEQTTVNPIEADLSISKDDSVDPVTIGDNFTYTIKVENHGPQTAKNVVLSDNLPNGVTFVSASPDQGSCNESNNNVTCNFGDINYGDFVSTQVIVNTTSIGSITNNVTVTSSTDDPVSNNNTASEQTTVNVIQADLVVSKSDAVDPVLVGAPVQYLVTVTNNGPKAAENVVLTDNLPAGVTFVSANSNQGSCNKSNGIVTCDLGTINNGASVEVTVIVNTTSVGSITNNASVVSSTTDPNNNNNATSEQTTVSLVSADLFITKTDAVDPVTERDNVIYTIRITNNGPQTAKNILLTDDLPEEMSFISANSNQGSCVENNGTVTCNIGDLSNGNTSVVTIEAETTTSGTLTNFANVIASTHDPNTNNNSTSEQTTVNALQADLSITKSDSVDPVKIGENITYTIVVTNNGPDTAENVELTDNLPNSVTFISSTPNQGSCSESNNTVSCELGDINNGSTANVVIEVKATSTGAITNNVSVTASTNDPSTNNNSTSEQTTVNALQADLSITKNDSVDPVKIGDHITYSIAVTNNGPDTAENVVLTDNLPNGLSFVSGIPGQGSCSESNNTVTCELGDISNGSTANITIEVKTTAPGNITNSASVTSDMDDPTNTNNTASEQTTVNDLEADLSIVKNDAVDPVIVGENITYRLNVTNLGPDIAENVILTDQLPDDVLFVLAMSSQGSCSVNNNIVTCNLNDIASNQTVEVTVIVKSTSAKTVTNDASVVSSTNDPDNSNNVTSEQTVVNLPAGADLAVSKSDLDDPVTVGNDINYTVTVTNNGPSIAENVNLTDTLPSGVTFVSANPEQGSCSESNNEITCNLGDLNNGDSVDVTIIVNTSATGLLTNNASVTSSIEDPISNNNTASEQTTVSEISQADLAVSKTDVLDPVTIGDIVTYTLTASNNGPAVAENVVLTDNLPNGVEFVSANLDVGSCSEANNIVTCTLGNVSNGGSVSVTIVVKSTSTGTITNNASITSSTSDPNINNNSTSEQTTVNSMSADLMITKNDNVDPVITGDNVTYTIKISNSGPHTAENVVVTDNLPADVSFVSANPDQGSCSESNGIVTCNLGDIVVDTSINVAIVVKTTLSGTITNNATVASSTNDLNNGNNSTSEQTTVNPVTADLSISKGDAVDPVNVGDNVVYTIMVSNNGPQTAEKVVLTDNLVGDGTFVSANSSQGVCVESNNQVTCALGNIGNGNSVTITIIFKSSTVGTITNVSNVTSSTTDPNNNNNTASEQTVIISNLRADLSITKVDMVDPVVVGEMATYTITGTNHGPDLAENVVITDDLPDGVEFVSATPSQGSCSVSNGVVTCNIGEMNNGDAATVTVILKTINKGQLSNSVSILSNTVDPNPSNNNATELTTVSPVMETDLSIEMSDVVDPVFLGNNVTYNILVSNLGSQTAENVLLTNHLPDEVVFTSATTNQGSCSQSNSTVTCELGTINASETVTVTIIAKSILPGIISNTATVTTSTGDVNNANDSASEQTNVIILVQAADISVTKVADVDSVWVGNNITYTVTVTNNGPDEADDVVLTDILPDNAAFLFSTSTQGNCSALDKTITCDMGSIGKDANAAATIVLQVVAAGNLLNTASATTSTFDPDSTNNNASVETMAIQLTHADLSVSQIDNTDPVTVGDSVAYTITVTNNGPNMAENVMLSDYLPNTVSFVSAIPSQGGCVESNEVVTCEIGNINASEKAIVTVIVQTNSSGQLNNTVSVTSNNLDSITDNNSSEEQTMAILGLMADLSVSNDDTVDPVNVGDNVTYTIIVNNSGPNVAENVVLTDRLPNSVLFLFSTTSQGSCVSTDNVLTCNLGSINTGENAEVNIFVKTTTEGTFTNTASVTSTTNDPDSNNNSESEETIVTVVQSVQLTSFTALNIGRYITLKWSTANETNNFGFDIERRRNGKQFTKIGAIEGNGTTSTSRNYVYVDSTAITGVYYYRLKQIDIDGTFAYSEIIQGQVNRPEGFILEQNYPNPFNPTTSIEYQLPQNAKVTLTIYNLIGQEVRKLLNEDKVAGFHTIVWDATDNQGNNVPSGVYVYVLRAGEFTAVKKLTLLK